MADQSFGLSEVYRWFQSLHQRHDPTRSQLPATSAFYGLLGTETLTHSDIMDAFLADSSAFRVPLELETILKLAQPDKGCGHCAGTGRRVALEPAASLCECLGGKFGVTWLR